ncbi:MAG: bifunctional [glutamine synthetase] adenylyltransferase/[glutamine synthetase]-adenylyl-L-tyrosine phosphorylase [Rhodobiaceae bacterium]|nr:bifunctional [glutamine synthetase] adenylyltransferase/[glutamine synthetase]-adenylyl-L-tyrosine phosphorylase [Rhodobiaceae bacterium]
MGSASSLLFAKLAATPERQPLDADHARALLGDIQTAASPDVQALLETHVDFFLWVVEGSGFLTRLMRRYPDVLQDLSRQSVDAYHAKLIHNMQATLAECPDRDIAMAELRHTRNKSALSIALADLADHWDVEQVTQALTHLADASVSAALDFLLHEAVRAQHLASFSRDGLVVLALGKHGGQELNYSSDIDFVVYYTPDALPLAADVDIRKFHISLVQELAAMLQNVTQDGFVFRVDLRLRPDPGATPVTVSVSAALGYYESMGQNWERAVYIKARPMAGDLAAGQRFIDDLQPYIWRRYFDFAAIEDVHSMKRQIHAVRGHAEIAAMGHNLKLGRGGIREIEFFVQTQQLIAGGRDPDLRGHRTVDMLAMLARKNWISDETATTLTACYYYLRRLEHRLQMRQDEQTQTLPMAPEPFASFARFAGFQTAPDFATDFTAQLAKVTQEYALLFEQSESLSGGEGNLVFTGNEDDPGTLETLADMGFTRGKEISALIRGWHAGRTGATRSQRAREILTRLQPTVLQRLAQGGDADGGFIRFHNFLESLPSGVQVFSLFQSNPHVLHLLIDIVTVAPRLSAFLGANSGLLDVLVQPVDVAPLSLALDTDNFETAMNQLRRHVHEEQFRIGTRVLADPVMAVRFGEAYSQLAQTSIEAMLAAAKADIERQYGKLTSGEMIVLGLGKLGSQEMTLQSDLDIILICDAADFSALSEGEKPISAEQWFARLARRFLSGLSAPTAEGGLFEVDTRLRPSGNAGPLVTKLSSFTQYQSQQAWTWEHMALTRARVMAGDAGLAERATQAIETLLGAPREPQKLVQDVVEMRARLRQHQPQAGPFDIRRGDGGLVDIEFIAQALQLRHAPDHASLIGTRELTRLLDDLAELHILGQSDYETLKSAAQTYLALRQIGSLCLEDNETHPVPATAGVLLEALNEPDMRRLEARLLDHRQAVGKIFETVLASLS